MNDKLYKCVLAPGLKPSAAAEGVTTVLNAPHNIPLEYLRWPLQLESKVMNQTNDVLVAIDHLSIWELV